MAPLPNNLGLRRRAVVYDFWSLGITARFAWHCPTRLRVQFYDQYITNRHLDIGPATGYLLDKCHFPSGTRNLVLLDRDARWLRFASQRLRRYDPINVVADVQQPIPLAAASFDSIGINYILHCLRGTLLDKGSILKTLRPLLAEGGLIFGTTILSQGVRHNGFGRAVMERYNRAGIFHNREDNLRDLGKILRDNFSDYATWVIGCVAFFTARAS